MGQATYNLTLNINNVTQAQSTTFYAKWPNLPQPPSTPNNTTAKAMLGFLQAIGVGDCMTSGDCSGIPSPTSAQDHINMFNYLGVKSARAGAYDLNFAIPILQATGVKIINYYADFSQNTTQVVNQFSALAAQNLIRAGEGENEPFNVAWSGVASYQHAQWVAIRAASALNGIPWTSVTLNGAEPGTESTANGNYGTQFAWAPGIPSGAGTNGAYPVGTQFSDIASIHDYTDCCGNSCPCPLNQVWDNTGPTGAFAGDFVTTYNAHYSGITAAQARDPVNFPRIATEWDVTPGNVEYQSVGVQNFYIDSFVQGYSSINRFALIEGYNNNDQTCGGPPCAGWHQGFYCNPNATINDCVQFTPSVFFNIWGSYPSADYLHSMTHFLADTGDVISPGTINWCGGSGCTAGSGFTNAACGTGGQNNSPLCHGLLLQKSASATFQPNSYNLLLTYEPAENGPTVSVPINLNQTFSNIIVYDLTKVVTPSQNAPSNPTPLVQCTNCSSITIPWDYRNHPSGGTPPPLDVVFF